MRLRYILLALVVVGGLAAAAFYGYVHEAMQLTGPLENAKLVYIEPGSSSKKIAGILDGAEVIDSPTVFALGAKMERAAGPLKAGEYEIPAGASMLDIIRLLQSGKTYQHHLTIPEGLTSAEIVALVNKADEMTGTVADIPQEGALLPETYNYSYHASRTALVTRMEKSMRDTLNDLWNQRAKDLPLKSKEEAVTLASVVERETGVATERARIAGVFYNRMKIGMPLQSDPTVIYALTLGKTKLDRPLSRADLGRESPYNTYLVKGLPPGPIANPGRASLKGVLNPETNDYLYFVANGSGGHAFGKSLEEHLRNVDAWHRLQHQ